MGKYDVQPLDLASIELASTIAAQLPAGELKLVGVSTPLPGPIARVLRTLLTHLAAGKSVTLVVGEVGTADDVEFSQYIAQKLAEDGKITRG